MFFDNWSGLVPVVVKGTLAYIGLVFLLRVSGKRTLSKMSAFDLIVTVALGSILATILLSKDVALVEGVVAFALLIVLQYIVAWLSVRSETVRNLVLAEPTLVLHRGKFLKTAMKASRVTEVDILDAVRQKGEISLSQIDAVVLESDGAFSVLPNQKRDDDSALNNVSKYE